MPTLTAREEAFARARSLAGEERFREAREILKPFMSISLSDSEIGFFLHCMAKDTPEQAARACGIAEKCLAQKPGSIPIQKEYFKALFEAYIVPCITSLGLTEKEYGEGRRAALRMLDISASSPSVLDRVLPFMRVAYRMGDREFLDTVKQRVDPEVFSDERLKIGGGKYSKRKEFLWLVRKDR